MKSQDIKRKERAHKDDSESIIIFERKLAAMPSPPKRFSTFIILTGGPSIRAPAHLLSFLLLRRTIGSIPRGRRGWRWRRRGRRRERRRRRDRGAARDSERKASLRCVERRRPTATTPTEFDTTTARWRWWREERVMGRMVGEEREG